MDSEYEGIDPDVPFHNPHTERKNKRSIETAFESANRYWEEEEKKAVDAAIRNVKKIRINEMYRLHAEYEDKYRKAVDIIKELHPFFGDDKDSTSYLIGAPKESTITHSNEPVHAPHTPSPPAIEEYKEDCEHMLDMTCVVCMDNPRDAFFGVCHHVVVCMKCAGEIKQHGYDTRTGEMTHRLYKCPKCRKISRSVKKVYF